MVASSSPGSMSLAFQVTTGRLARAARACRGNT
jgi:hypothetical protein